MDKVDTVEQALAGVTDGATLAVGGFGLCGLPSTWIAPLHRSTVTDLRIVSNKCGIDDWGLGLLLGDQTQGFAETSRNPQHLGQDRFHLRIGHLRPPLPARLPQQGRRRTAGAAINRMHPW